MAPSAIRYGWDADDSSIRVRIAVLLHRVLTPVDAGTGEHVRLPSKDHLARAQRDWKVSTAAG